MARDVSFREALVFSFFVSSVMVMLDALYHLGTSTAVHINYVLVKITIIFLVLFLTTYWVGKGKNEGIFACIVGPVIFYIYYLVADSTLNRAVFKVDDSFGYIFLHIFAFAIAYIALYNFVLNRRGSKEIQAGALSLIMAFSVFALDSFYRLGKVQIQTKNEELVVAVMGFGESLYLVLFLMVLYFLVFYYLKGGKTQGIVYMIGSLLGVYVISGGSVERVLVGVVSAGLPLMLMNYYLSRVVGMNNGVKSNGK